MESWHWPFKGWFSFPTDGIVFFLIHAVIPGQLLGELGVLVSFRVSEGFTLCRATGAPRGRVVPDLPLNKHRASQSDSI